MVIYNYSKAKQNLALVLKQAIKEGEVRIKDENGQIFIIKPEPKEDSPLDVEGVNLGITTSEIIQFIREGRRGISPEGHEERRGDKR